MIFQCLSRLKILKLIFSSKKKIVKKNLAVSNTKTKKIKFSFISQKLTFNGNKIHHDFLSVKKKIIFVVKIKC